MLRPIVAHQSFADRPNRGLAARIAILCQVLRITPASRDRPNDTHLGQPANAQDAMLQLNVHLRPRLPQVLNVRSRVVQETPSLAQIGPQYGVS